jgi:hypothetical protein
MATINKLVDAAITLMCHSAMSKGAYPEVEFRPSATLLKMGACNLSEYMKVMPIFARAFDLELKKKGYDKGVYLMVRSEAQKQKLQADLKEIMANMVPVCPADLKVGQNIRLRTRGEGRWLTAKIAQRGINHEQGILTVDIDDGPYSETDTDVYIHDIRVVETEKGWQPFDLNTEEDRAFKARVLKAGG